MWKKASYNFVVSESIGKWLRKKRCHFFLTRDGFNCIYKDIWLIAMLNKEKLTAPQNGMREVICFLHRILECVVNTLLQVLSPYFAFSPMIQLNSYTHKMF